MSPQLAADAMIAAAAFLAGWICCYIAVWVHHGHHDHWKGHR
jgi:hypothetical protein